MSRTRTLLLRSYVVALLVVAVLLLAHGQYGIEPGPRFWNAFGALVGLGILAEFLALPIGIGGVRMSARFVPHLTAILLLGPSWAMVVAGVISLPTETLLQRKPLLKVAHNFAKDVVAVAVAGHIYVFAGGVPSLTTFYLNLPAFFAAVIPYFLILNGTTATAVTLDRGAELWEAWSRIVGRDLPQDVLSASIAVLLAFLYIELEFWGLVLVLVPILFFRHELHQKLQLEQMNRDLLELMVKQIEGRDPYTSGHSLRVASYAKVLARALGLGAKDIEQIETAALLHDVGKIWLDQYDPILRKEGKLTEAERRIMQSHPVRSAELVATITSLRGNVVKCVKAHHESYDGSGYPDGLAGREIPMGARIIMVADTADAMMTDRPYRKALSYERVIEEFERCSGTQFDPEVVRAFRHSTAIRRLIEERQATAPLPSTRFASARLAAAGGSTHAKPTGLGKTSAIREHLTS